MEVSYINWNAGYWWVTAGVGHVLPLTSSRASTCTLDSGINHMQELASFLHPDKVLDFIGTKVTAKADCVQYKSVYLLRTNKPRFPFSSLRQQPLTLRRWKLPFLIGATQCTSFLYSKDFADATIWDTCEIYLTFVPIRLPLAVDKFVSLPYVKCSASRLTLLRRFTESHGNGY